jgi:hypothetical protein
MGLGEDRLRMLQKRGECHKWMMFMKELVVELLKCLHGVLEGLGAGRNSNVIALTTPGLAPWLVEWRWTTESTMGGERHFPLAGIRTGT